MAPDIADDPPSFGWIFERIDKVKDTAHEVQQESTELYERQLADAMWDLAYSMEDIAVILRDHLACHDCPEEEELDGSKEPSG